MPQVAPVLLSPELVLTASVVVLDEPTLLVATAVVELVAASPVVGKAPVLVDEVVGAPVVLLCPAGGAPQNPSLHASSVPQSLSPLQGCPARN